MTYTLLAFSGVSNSFHKLSISCSFFSSKTWQGESKIHIHKIQQQYSYAHVSLSKYKSKHQNYTLALKKMLKCYWKRHPHKDCYWWWIMGAAYQTCLEGHSHPLLSWREQSPVGDMRCHVTHNLVHFYPTPGHLNKLAFFKLLKDREAQFWMAFTSFPTSSF